MRYPVNMQSVRVLIVADLPQVREGLATVLTLAGSAAGLAVEVVGAGQAEQETGQPTGTPPLDVLLLDLEMPGLHGWATVRRLQAEWPGLRLVILSIHTPAEARRRTRAAGYAASGAACVAKGDRAENLLRAVMGHPETTRATNSSAGEKS